LASIESNLQNVRAKVAKAAIKAGRKPEDIQIVAVTKTVDIPQIEEAIAAGVTAIGENRVQEVMRKQPLLHNNVDWHLIGHLQTNKVKYIIDGVRLIHSVESLSLVKEISKRAVQKGIIMPILVQVNVAKEETKHGLEIEQVIPFLKETAGYQGAEVQGLMTMAPLVDDPEEVRFVFKELRLLAERINGEIIPGVEMKHLSMGMTNDYEVAVEEGATLVRVGTGIFGKRI